MAEHIRIDKQGHVHLLSSTRYRLKDAILLYLIGRKYAFEAKIVDDDTVSIAEISSALGQDAQTVAARLSELREEGKVEAPARGRSRVIFARVPQALTEMKAR